MVSARAMTMRIRPNMRSHGRANACSCQETRDYPFDAGRRILPPMEPNDPPTEDNAPPEQPPPPDFIPHIVAWLQRHWGDERKCPYCGSTAWTVFPPAAFTLGSFSPTNAGFVPLWLVTVSCG